LSDHVLNFDSVFREILGKVPLAFEQCHGEIRIPGQFVDIGNVRWELLLLDAANTKPPKAGGTQVMETKDQ
jgi:hypothetical protein